MNEEGLNPRVRTVLVTATIGSLVAFILFLVFPHEFSDVTSPFANSFSRSALGHHSVVELLKKLEVPVAISRFATKQKAETASLLVLAEPPPGSEAIREEASPLLELLDSAPNVLLVLPKRTGRPNPVKPVWLKDVAMYKTELLDPMLAAVGIEGKVVREKPADVSWSNAFAVQPTLPDPQWIQSKTLHPLVSRGDHILVGSVEREGSTVVVVSDPDLFATHGLHLGDNALLVARLISEMREGNGPVLWDETLHGFELQPNFWKELLRFPLVLGVVQALLACALWIWAGMGRFGKALPETQALTFGKAYLISNTAELLRFGGHSAVALREYWKAAYQTVLHQLRAPRSPEARAWLNRIASVRGLQLNADALEAEVASAATERHLLRTALRIHQWKRDMLHGTATHPNARRTDTATDSPRGGGT